MPIPRADFQGDGGRFPFLEKPVRADIFVVWRFQNESSSVGATSWRPTARTGICRPDGAGIWFGLCFYKDAAPTALPLVPFSQPSLLLS